MFPSIMSTSIYNQYSDPWDTLGLQETTKKKQKKKKKRKEKKRKKKRKG